SRGFALRSEYDALRRRRKLYEAHTETQNNQPVTVESLRELLLYGEGTPSDPKTDNLRGRLYRHYDRAGVLTNESYDFKGNVLQTTRRVTLICDNNGAVDPSLVTPDLSTLDNITSYATIESTADSLLESAAGDRANGIPEGAFTVALEYDALN